MAKREEVERVDLVAAALMKRLSQYRVFWGFLNPIHRSLSLELMTEADDFRGA